MSGRVDPPRRRHPSRYLPLLLPASMREVVAGDLDEIRQTTDMSRLRYLRIVVASIVSCWLSRQRTASQSGPAGDSLMSTVLQDIAYGIRMLRRAPGFTAAAVLTLALGIGVNTATFGIVNVLSFKPLPYRNPERVAFLLGWSTERRERLFNMPLADALDLGAQARAFDAVGAYQYWSANITGGDQPERLQAYKVTANTFALLGVEPLRGRALTADDGRPDAPDVAVLSYGLWQRRFAGAPAIVGQPIMLDGHAHTVVGVMPASFEFPVFNFKGEAWTPIKVNGSTGTVRGSSPSIVAIARLKPGVAYQAAQADVDVTMRRFEADYPQTNRSLGAQVLEMRTLGDEINGQGAPPAVIAMAAVGFVLLLACANVANLLLARGVAREREFAIRAAIGASRNRLIRQLLTESLLLAGAGCILGVAVAEWSLTLLRAWLPELVLSTMPNVLELGVDRTTLAFSAAIAVSCAVLFGVGTAFRSVRADLQSSLKSGGHGAAGPRHQRMRAALMIGEVAISMILLVAAGLLVKTFNRLQHIDTGFNSRGVVTMAMSLPEYRYADAAARRQFFEAAVDRVARVPGVTSASFVNVLPLSTYNNGTRYIVDEGALPEPGREPATDYRIATPDYFRTLQIPVVAGRTFDSRDRPDTQGVVVVNRAFARRAFGVADPLGRRIRLGRRNSNSAWLTVVGVVGDVRHSEVTVPANAEVYRPFAQAPAAVMMLAARVSGDAQAAVDRVRAAIGEVDPAQPVYHVKTLQQLSDEALTARAAAMSMMSLFGALALLLATVGIYGVISYAVNQQMPEFGVRLALGASPRDVLRLVFRRGLSLVLAGAALGTVGALGVSRLMARALYGVTPADAATYVIVAGGLILVGVAACYLPARRAMGVDPVVVLRAD